MAATKSKKDTTKFSRKETENLEKKTDSSSEQTKKTNTVVRQEALGQYYKNISIYIHYVNDLGLMFYPNESKNLSLETENKIKNSVDLKKSLDLNILQQLTKSQYESEEKITYQVR